MKNTQENLQNSTEKNSLQNTQENKQAAQESTQAEIKSNTQKKSNWLMKLWNYFTTYEKIWFALLAIAGIFVAIFFPEGKTWVTIVSFIILVGGCSCELLLSKQSKWAFIVSFVIYDLPQIAVYVEAGYYVSAIFEVVFWIPMLFISFYFWDKKKDATNEQLTQVKGINWKKDVVLFVSVLAISLGTGALFTWLGERFPTLSDVSDYWYIDAIANTFSCLNGLFLLSRNKEQWYAWYGVCICETVLWILDGNWVMLILQVGYLTNTTYGLIQWSRYIKKHKNEQNDTSITANNPQNNTLENDVMIKNSENEVTTEQKLLSAKEQITETKKSVKGKQTQKGSKSKTSPKAKTEK